MKRTMTTIDIEEILDDYRPDDDDIFNEDTEEMKKLKHIIYTDLDEVDRRVILLYAELGSLRKLGSILGVSASSAFLKIKTIKKKIQDLL